MWVYLIGWILSSVSNRDNRRIVEQILMIQCYTERDHSIPWICINITQKVNQNLLRLVNLNELIQL